MPLPTFTDFSAAWIEKTKASHEHGGLGWEFGSCLWSPATDKAGKKIYEDMKRVRPNDIILHFYEDEWFGGQAAYHFCGFSLATASCVVRTDEPPKAAAWASRGDYYRIDLKAFTPFEETIPLEDVVARHTEILRVVAHQPKGPFVLYKNNPRLAQGKYLSQCSAELYECLSTDIIEPFPTPQFQLQKTNKSVNPVDSNSHEEFLEGQRQRRESSYFLRNRRLVAEAKATHGLACQACGFNFHNTYGDIGSGFIECHHLNPLSERYRSKAAPSSNIRDVSVLCSNCHRMIHRLMRKEKRWIPLDELRKLLTD